jgi:hypothetical protein
MKTFEEIMSGITDHIHYDRSASQLTSLALTKFAEEITQKGATILNCSPKQIKLDDGTVVKVIGTYLKYTYNEETIYYIQFDDNPFFGASGYITEKNGISTGVTELPIVYNDVNEYLVEEKNIEQLFNNIFIAEDYLKKLSRIRKDKDVKITQNIYYF